MKAFSFLGVAFATLGAAQTPAPYTDSKSGITFNTLQHSSGLFFGLALPQNGTGNTDFIATIGGKGTGYSGVSLGGGMLGKLLVLAWPNQQSVVSSFRKTAYVQMTIGHVNELVDFKLTRHSETMARPLLQRALSRRSQSQMARTSTAHIGHTLSFAPSASRPTAQHSKRRILHQASGLRSMPMRQLRKQTLPLPYQSILHRGRRCSISARQRATNLTHGRAGQSRLLLSVSMLE